MSGGEAAGGCVYEIEEATGNDEDVGGDVVDNGGADDGGSARCDARDRAELRAAADGRTAAKEALMNFASSPPCDHVAGSASL